MTKAVLPRGGSGPPISGSFTVERLLRSEPLQIPMVNAQLNGFANCSSCGARISGSTMGRDQSGSNRWDADELRWSSLMSDAQSGNRKAYEMLLSELGVAIEDYVRSRFGAIDVLEDCVQESLLALHRSRHTYDPRKPFRPWLFTVVRHRCIEMRRRCRCPGCRQSRGQNGEPQRQDGAGPHGRDAEPSGCKGIPGSRGSDHSPGGL